MALSTPFEVQPEINPTPWVEIVAARYGLQFGPTRVRRLVQGLQRRIQATGIAAQSYINQLLEEADAEEWQALVSELVVGETRFFRHPPSFSLLREMLIPERLQAAKTRGAAVCSILSAGCANGAETYSLAMCALPLCREHGLRLQVVGMDLCDRAIAQAILGQYKARAMRGLDSEKKAVFFTTDDGGFTFKIRPELSGAVDFKQANLHQRQHLGQLYDIIFCQNLFIYLSKPDRQKMLSLFADHLLPHGYLILGPAEVYKSQDQRLQKLDFEQTLVYQQKPSPAVNP